MIRILLSILLTILLVITISINHYFEIKNEKLKKHNIALEKEYKKLLKSNTTVKWIEKNILPKTKSLNSKEEAINQLLFFYGNNKKQFNLRLTKIDKSKNGYININSKASIDRNDLQKLKKLFELKITNGFISIESIKASKEKLIINLNFVKGYK